MSRRFAKQPMSGVESVAVLKLEKSGGCVDRDKKYLQQMRQAQIKEYFFGMAANALSPHAQLIDFGDVTIYRFKDGRISPQRADEADISRLGHAGLLPSWWRS